MGEQLIGSLTTLDATMMQGENVLHFEGPIEAEGEDISTMISN